MTNEPSTESANNREAAEKRLWERLNSKQIKRSEIPARIRPGDPLRDAPPLLGVSFPVSEKDLIAAIDERHRSLWDRMIGAGCGARKFQAQVMPSEEIAKLWTDSRNVSRYDRNTQTIHIMIPVETVGDPLLLKRSATSGQLPVWEIELLHELVHERQNKYVTCASPQGNSLMESHQKSGRSFPGPHHDQTFYAAICECAARIEVSDQLLLDNI